MVLKFQKYMQDEGSLLPKKIWLMKSLSAAFIGLAFAVSIAP
jgi:hypothetical protein